MAVRRDWYGSQLYLLIAPSLHKSLLLLAGKALEHHTCSTCSRYELLLTALCVCVGCWFSIYSLLVSLCVCVFSPPPLSAVCFSLNLAKANDTADLPGEALL